MNTTENLDLNVDIENNKNHQENAKLMNCENSQKLDTNSTDLKENRIGTQICDTNIDDNDDDSTSYSSLSSFESVDATNDDNEVGEGDEDPERDDTLPTEVPKSANEISVHVTIHFVTFC
jgi:stress response protein SCP2